MLQYSNCLYVVTVPRISLQPSGYLQGVVGEMQNINCSVSISSMLYLDSVELLWINDNVIVTDDNRIIIATYITENPSSFTYTTIIQFAYLMERDEGNYTCIVEVDDMVESRSIMLENLRSKQTYKLSSIKIYMLTYILFICSTQSCCRGYQY